MTIRNLDRAARPTSVAVFGASKREDSVGRVVVENIVTAGFEGQVWPVNPKYEEVAGLPCYSSASALPEPPDLAVIVTPARTVPGIIAELAAKGTRAAVVITAGVTQKSGLRQAMLAAARPALFRIIGPNTLGLMIPPIGLNASFAHMAPQPGNIALLSQSGAIATSLIDWAEDNNVGFSYIVSLGDMADVDVGDWLDLLAGDATTKAIMLYLETIPDPRKFMSAARAASRLKPVVVVKAGRHAAGAKAAATHTGALAGADRVVDAALRRAGILRVTGLGELFDAVEITARFRPLDRARLGIVTNGGGAGVLALDQLEDCGGDLAELTPETLARLDRVLPTGWSGANPVDIIGDAPAARYVEAVKAVAADPAVDVLLVLNCPTALASPSQSAEAVAALTENGRIGSKPVLTCWLGDRTAREGRRILQDAGVVSFETPAAAVTALSYLSDWAKAQTALTRVPSSRSEDVASDRTAVLELFRQAAKEGRRMLTEPEAKAAIQAYGIPVPRTIIAHSPHEAGMAAEQLLKTSRRVVVKLLSKEVSHKSDLGGVILNLRSAIEVERAAVEIERRVRERAPAANLEGYAVQPMVERVDAQELILGMTRDPIFGPAIMFGAGGVAVEVVDDTAIALPPLDNVLAGDLIERTRIGRLLAGFRDRAPADRKAIETALNGLSQMVVDFPCITAIDINPLLADSDGVIALDARIQIDPARVEEAGPNPDLAIRPYPAGWDTELEAGGDRYRLRPIKPADVELYPEFLNQVSPGDIRLRFLSPRKSFPDSGMKRLTQLDYDREIAFVAVNRESGELAGVSRLSCDPDRSMGEYAVLVRSDLQGRGLGWALLKKIVDWAEAEEVQRVEGLILSENHKMLSMAQDFGFKISRHPTELGVSLATLVIQPAV